MSLHPVHFSGILPIPVGHQVEVRIYAAEEGLFSKAWVAHPEDPWLLDHTTGVVYGSAWHYKVIAMYRPNEVIPDLPMDVRSDLKEHARMFGVVKSSRIVWIGGGDSRYPQTTLIIDAR